MTGRSSHERAVHICYGRLLTKNRVSSLPACLRSLLSVSVLLSLTLSLRMQKEDPQELRGQQAGVVGHGRAPKDLVAEIRLKGQWV